MKNNKKLQINSDWYVPIILFIIGIIVYIVDLVINKFRILSIFQVFGCWAFSCVIPIANTRFEVKAPIIVNVLIAILIFIGAFLGGVFAFYDLISYWDTICHTFFGIVSGSFFIYFLRLFHIDRINFFAIAILEFTFTLGLAAGWEIIEFTIDYLYETDFQKVVLSMQDGKLPQWDTMIDIIVALFGSIIHYIFYILQIKKVK